MRLMMRSHFASFAAATESLQEPVIQWWVRVLYADGTSPGWLLVDGDVSLSWLPCCRATHVELTAGTAISRNKENIDEHRAIGD